MRYFFQAATSICAAVLVMGCAGIETRDLATRVAHSETLAVGVVAIEATRSKRKAMAFDLSIQRLLGEGVCVAPDQVIVMDAGGRTLGLIGADRFISHLHGETPEEAVSRAQSAALFPGPAPASGGGFAGGMAAGMDGFAGAYAMSQARERYREIQEEDALALRRQPLLPGAYLQGRIWTAAGIPPYRLTVFACGEQVTVQVP